jgi:hypothetical protein
MIAAHPSSGIASPSILVSQAPLETTGRNAEMCVTLSETASSVVGTVKVGRTPMAIAITNNGNGSPHSLRLNMSSTIRWFRMAQPSEAGTLCG